MIDAKRYLQQIQLCDSRINTRLEELHRLKEMVVRITPTPKDNIASGGCGSQDKLANAVAKIVDLEAEIDREIDYFVNARRKIVALIDKLSDPDQIQVLHKRYVQYKTLERIACDMGMSYRNVCYIHGKGLQAVNEIMKGKANDN